MAAEVRISEVPAEDFAALLPELAALMQACVQAGANINFVLPFSLEDSAAFWREKILPGLRSGGRVLWVARRDGALAGSVQLLREMPPNQAHRAEVSKLMVHPESRRLGIAQALMGALEARAAGEGRSLITLDTLSDGAAERLYASLGYLAVGRIPDFCRDPFEDRLEPTTVMYKKLG